MSAEAPLQAVCVFCGSRLGNNPRYAQAARELAQGMAQRGLTLVYGGGSVGLMGVLADAMLAAGGRVLGVIPKFLDQMEVGHKGLQELILVESMWERKSAMEAHADAFIVLPGGYGTLDELFEFIALSQLQQHQKPVILFNQAGFYDAQLKQLDVMVDEGFVKPQYRSLVAEVQDLPQLFAALGRP